MTIAVKRDRAVEPLLQNGSKFVVNILAEGTDRVGVHVTGDALCSRAVFAGVSNSQQGIQ
jgi:flavin reductase (DIM6/NTAB) family NADH-FMN oxidoreductase RutF